MFSHIGMNGYIGIGILIAALSFRWIVEKRRSMTGGDW